MLSGVARVGRELSAGRAARACVGGPGHAAAAQGGLTGVLMSRRPRAVRRQAQNSATGQPVQAVWGVQRGTEGKTGAGTDVVAGGKRDSSRRFDFMTNDQSLIDGRGLTWVRGSNSGHCQVAAPPRACPFPLASQTSSAAKEAAPAGAAGVTPSVPTRSSLAVLHFIDRSSAIVLAPPLPPAFPGPLAK